MFIGVCNTGLIALPHLTEMVILHSLHLAVCFQTAFLVYLCHAVQRFTAVFNAEQWCRTEQRCAVLCFALLCCDALCCSVLCCAVLRCAALRCAVLYCPVTCWPVQFCAVQCWAPPQEAYTVQLQCVMRENRCCRWLHASECPLPPEHEALCVTQLQHPPLPWAQQPQDRPSPSRFTSLRLSRHARFFSLPRLLTPLCVSTSALPPYLLPCTPALHRHPYLFFAASLWSACQPRMCMSMKEALVVYTPMHAPPTVRALACYSAATF